MWTLGGVDTFVLRSSRNRPYQNESGGRRHRDREAAEGMALGCLAFTVFTTAAAGKAAEDDGFGTALFKAVSGEGWVRGHEVEDHLVCKG